MAPASARETNGGARKRTSTGRTSHPMSCIRGCLLQMIVFTISCSKIGLHDLRSKLTITRRTRCSSQAPVRANLDPFKTKSDEDIWAALELSHLKAFVDKGLEHEVQEGGENLGSA
ncbi:hypothetical protein V5799_005885 [Amblyomma americanum]|uniref:Uncharacterized protein n=1 Tax=Amblyomma americanum TaxID=6943 RepID=A0AAQ4DY05_AMBAM